MKAYMTLQALDVLMEATPCFNYPSESEMNKNSIFSAFFLNVVKLYETYPQVLIKKVCTKLE